MAEAVSVQRLNVPDLVVIDQLNQPQLPNQHPGRQSSEQNKTQNINPPNSKNGPEAASLINGHDLSANEAQSQIVFECLISFDKRKDKNLIVKWHHDDRIEPIYQWIPELNKRSIAPQYRAYIAPVAPNPQQATRTLDAQAGSNQNSSTSSNQTQLLEAGFRLVRPTKELGGKLVAGNSTEVRKPL